MERALLVKYSKNETKETRNWRVKTAEE